ncbi:DNA repair endonuclease XPF mei-9 isoform X1 [Rhynchophorus ferrugineus]|uniref:DNA repair endonuclease XPF mei-9 isoform X1 n=2 Tax=Rhynchophorus ferrugineus TaxID=354439 RepID=UPI003FCE0451
MEFDEIAKLIEKAEVEHMLEFETQIFLDIVQNDGLVIAAKGINLDIVVSNVLKVYQDPGNLIIVLNATAAEEKYFQNRLNGQDIYIQHGNDREEEYLCGGIHSVSTRIFIVDLLKKRIPIANITGIVILRAHRIFESCNEAFALRLYRQNNKTGFIKAFSNSAQGFTMGFCHVERVMRALFVKELYIWPRFHLLIRECLKKYEPIVVELHISITDKMKKMQTYILEIMNMTVKELKKLNPTLEMQEITVENCLTKKFHKLLQAELNEIWHQLSNRSCQLIAELKTLRHLLLMLFYSDSVTFYSTLLEYRKPEYARNADWVLNHSAELLFRDCNTLVLSGDRELNPELAPKWKALLDLLKIEIPAEIRQFQVKNCTVLILCSDSRTCYQINTLLTSSPQQYLLFLALKNKISFKSLSKQFKNCEVSHSTFSTEEQNPKSKRKLKIDEDAGETETEEKDCHNEVDEDNEQFQNTYILTMNESILEESSDHNDSVFTPYTQMENIDLSQISETISSPKILIQTFKGCEDYISLEQNLHILKPNYIIMYHSNITATREIEMYEAHRQENNRLKIYYLIYAGTVEEQAYLTSLRREKEAFEYLIETKAKMVIPADQDGKSDQCTTLQRGTGIPEKNTRQGGQAVAPDRTFVIVDMREFRSDLPSLIHKRGIDIEPLTISVGDYILTPDICVERKSVSDLIQSLNSGRLYQQCMQMQRYYSKPMLLIEFDQNRAFGWKSHYMLSADSNSFEVQQKLLLLTIHFPKLKIIWSPNPYATAQLFEELKQDKGEPNIENALAVGCDQDISQIETKYNSTMYDFVQKLPGITTKNIDQCMRNGKNLKELAQKTEEELKILLGNSLDAKALYLALHEKCSPQEAQKNKFMLKKGASSTRGGNKRMRGK